jgi:hypothetical protein
MKQAVPRPTIRSSLPRVLVWLAAPAFWLERARGRWRIVLALFYMLVIAVAGLLVWRALSLKDLPVVGEPFDTATFGTVHLPDDRNAFVLYRQATDRLVQLPDKKRSGLTYDWKRTDREVREWVEKNRQAIDLFVAGSARPEALYHQPKDITILIRLPVVQSLRVLTQLALMEAARRENDGDVGGAWEMYRAVLRGSRHAGRRSMAIQRLVGTAMLRMGSNRLIQWANNPKVSSALLHRALDDVASCQAMTAPSSDTLKVEYLMDRHAVAHYDSLGENDRRSDRVWYHHLPSYHEAAMFLKREPERSLRVMDLVFANWLIVCDRPAGARPRVAKTSFPLYELDPALPVGARTVSPEVLSSWVKSAQLAEQVLPRGPSILAVLDSEEALFRTLEVHLAEQCYEREHGELPNSPEALARYLHHRPGEEVTPASNSGSQNAR